MKLARLRAQFVSVGERLKRQMVVFAACDRVSEIVESNTPEMTESSDHITLGVVLP